MKLKKIIQVAMVAGIFSSASVMASPATIWTDSSGNPIRDSNGNCVQTGSWSKDVRNICSEPEVAPVEIQALAEPEILEEEVIEPEELLVEAEPEPEANKEILKTVNLDAAAAFAVGSAWLSLETRATIAEIAADLKELENVESIVIEGHTDNTGTEFVNNQLSQQRADRVKEELVNNGIEAEKIEARGYGSSKPLVSNDTEAGRIKNRRVEIHVHGSKLVVKSISLDSAAAFAVGSAWLSLETRTTVAEIAEGIKELENFESLVIEGHTDDTGTEFVNNQLSQQRADRIKEEFVKNGLEAKRVEAKGYGSSKPLVSNKTEEGRIKNRRVEIHIFSR